MSAALPVPSEATSRRWLWLLLLAYAVLVVAGQLTRREIFPLLALMVLATAVVLPRLARGRLAPWLVWAGIQGTLLALAAFGLVDLVLECVPLLVNALLAWWFGRTLRTSRPLIARCIVAIEGESRLRERGVARYARQLTAFWAASLATHALLLGVLLLGAERSGVLARIGALPSLRVDEWWAATWLHVGGYVVVALIFALEYPYRLWRLRHLQHMRLPQMVLRLAVNWPRLLRDEADWR